MFWLGFLAFIKKPIAKYIGGALVLGLALWFGVHQFNNWKDGIREEGRLQGRKEVTMEFQAIVDENNRVNRRVEEKVDNALDLFVGKLNKTLDRVRGESSKIAGDILAQIDRQPQTFNNRLCDTPKATIDSRNAIRRLGPARMTTTLPEPSSSVTVALPAAKE